MSAGRAHIGCSGWVYKHWRGPVYPPDLPAKKWFEHYTGMFDSVEINNSFYRLPTAETFRKWRDQAPPGFDYAVKANRYLTQAKKLKDCEEPIERQMASFRCLGDRLGPILYQLPPSLKLNLERLESFLRLVPRDVTNVFEFRDRSWYVPDTLALLERYGASFCVHDMGGCVTERVAVGPAAVAVVAQPLGQVEHDRDRQAVVPPGERDERGAGLPLHVRRVDDSEQVITFNDINDGAREVYRIYQNPDGTAWRKSE
mgnify:CR=1 FL=1